jgi:hypothetical protein
MVQMLGFFDHLPLASRLLRKMVNTDNTRWIAKSVYFLILSSSPPSPWGPGKPMGPPHRDLHNPSHPSHPSRFRLGVAVSCELCGDGGHVSASARLSCSQPSMGSSSTGFSIPFHLLCSCGLRSGHGLDLCQWNGFLKPFPTTHVFYGMVFETPPGGTFFCFEYD